MLIIPYLLYVALPDPGDFLIFTEMNNEPEIVPSDMLKLIHSEEVGKINVLKRENIFFWTMYWVLNVLCKTSEI